MQWHFSGGPTKLVAENDADKMKQIDWLLGNWDADWVSAELWQMGRLIVTAIQVPRLDSDSDRQIVVTWNDGKNVCVEVWNTTDGGWTLKRHDLPL